MKHLFVKDDEMSFMVYYPPKKKALLYELMFKRTQEYWKTNEAESSYTSLLPNLIKHLQRNGFKCVDITIEKQETIDIYGDINEDSFMYRGVEISESQYGGYSFWVGKTLNICLTIEEAINTIDKELK